MAKCRIASQRVITLDLNEAEAIVLLDVTRSIAGQTTGPRGQMDNVSAALQSAGVPCIHQPTRDGCDVIDFARSTTIVD